MQGLQVLAAGGRRLRPACGAGAGGASRAMARSHGRGSRSRGPAIGVTRSAEGSWGGLAPGVLLCPTPITASVVLRSFRAGDELGVRSACQGPPQGLPVGNPRFRPPTRPGPAPSGRTRSGAETTVDGPDEPVDSRWGTAWPVVTLPIPKGVGCNPSVSTPGETRHVLGSCPVEEETNKSADPSVGSVSIASLEAADEDAVWLHLPLVLGAVT